MSQVVSVWHRAWLDGGADALRSAGPPGARRRASDEGFAEVGAVLEAGPEAAGFTGQVWTLARVGRVITQVTGVVYASPSSVWRLLRAHGWSRQRRAACVGAGRGGSDDLEEHGVAPETRLSPMRRDGLPITA
ncbi:winged helix-turn-helix domain-containing protein [Embleya sp. NPDC059237]|uniref:winged helix-turn-helix domain-containing protein n=1 Tax=Embleya sp. NPDC059237 TaxID=3346784 RepID=UPI0036AA72D5